MIETGKSGPPRLDTAKGALESAPDSHGSSAEGAAHLRLERALTAELARLADEFGDALPEQLVVDEFTSCVRSFETARIRLYVPVLSYRNARQALRARALALVVERGEDITGPVLSPSRESTSPRAPRRDPRR